MDGEARRAAYASEVEKGPGALLAPPAEISMVYPEPHLFADEF